MREIIIIIPKKLSLITVGAGVMLISNSTLCAKIIPYTILLV